jgi:F-type H+-transporting ATPase subunit delta
VGAALSDDTVVRRLEDPSVALSDRHAAFEALFEGSRMLAQLSNLIGLVLRRRRLELVPAIAREFRRLYNRDAGIVEATATSAAELDEREVDALRSRLEQFTGGSVELGLQVDPELLGGVLVRIGDLLIDGSVRGRLERLRRGLLAGSFAP